MSMRKRFLFAMLFTIVALAAAGGVSVYKAEFDVPKPNTWSRAPVPAAAALPWYDSQLANMPSRWLKAFPTKGELLPALFLPIQLNTPQDWVLESCWWRAAASATRISQEQWSCWSATMRKRRTRTDSQPAHRCPAFSGS